MTDSDKILVACGILLLLGLSLVAAVQAVASAYLPVLIPVYVAVAALLVFRVARADPASSATQD